MQMHKICKCTRVSNCPLSSLEQFLALILRYISFIYSVDNGFNLALGIVNFMTVLNHFLYVSLTLIALMTDMVFIIQQAYFSAVDSQALLTSIR